MDPIGRPGVALRPSCRRWQPSRLQTSRLLSLDPGSDTKLWGGGAAAMLDEDVTEVEAGAALCPLLLVRGGAGR